MRKMFLLGLMASTMSAATLVVSDATVNFNNLSTNLSGRPTGSGETLTVGQFNPALGTLNSVSILVESYLKYRYSVNNNEANPATSNFGFVFLPTVSVNGQNVAYVNTGSLFPIYPPGASSGPLGAFGNFTSVIYYDNTSDLNTAGTLAAFTGVGSLNYSTTPSAIFVNDCSGDCDVEHISRYGARVTVTYDYTPNDPGVPEPATLALIGGGLIGFALLRRKA